MKLRTPVIFAALILTISTAWAAKSEFTISIATIRNTLPAGEQVPDAPPGAREVKKQLSFTLTSDSKPLPAAIAEVWVPESLGQGRKVKLAIEPQINQPSPEDLALETLQMKVYWGSSEQVKPGQPRLLTWKDFPESVKNAVKPDGKTAERSAAEWTADSSEFKDDVVLAGEYNLMSYAGSAGITLDSSQEFLPPVEVESLAGLQGTDQIYVSWKPVEGAQAYFVTAHGALPDGTLVGWTSGESTDAARLACIDECLSEKRLAELVKKDILLSPNETRVSIPAGVFTGSDGVMVVVTAYGKDKEVGGKEITAKAIVRSSAAVLKEFRAQPKLPQDVPLEKPY